MRIAQLAERTGVPATTLRFYDTTGLLPAGRTPSGYRVYGQDAVERLAFIGAARHLGLRLEEIGELLGVWSSGACADVKAELRPRVVARLAEAETRLADLAAFTASLRRALDQLDALPDRTGRCDPGCGFLDPPLRAGSRPAGPSPRPAEHDQRAAPVACSLSGDDLAERLARWRRLLDGAHQARIDEGVRLTLPADRAAEVAALAVDEQRCCPFFDIRLHLAGPALHLEVRVPDGGTELLADLLGTSA